MLLLRAALAFFRLTDELIHAWLGNFLQDIKWQINTLTWSKKNPGYQLVDLLVGIYVGL